MSAKTYRTVPVRNLSSDELLELSKKQKLSLSREDMEVVQQIFREIDRDPTDVELEVIAQTWSEHCKHRIFSASINHSVNGGAPETVNSLFKTYIKKPSEKSWNASRASCSARSTTMPASSPWTTTWPSA